MSTTEREERGVEKMSTWASSRTLTFVSQERRELGLGLGRSGGMQFGK
jgi:uncharacterized protein